MLSRLRRAELLRLFLLLIKNERTNRYEMANEQFIIIRSGLTPVHSFDLWGVIVDAYKLSNRKIVLYRQLAREKRFNPEEASKAIHDYEGLRDGKDWATGARKIDIIDALENPLEAFDINPYSSDVFTEDGLHVLEQIFESNEGAVIFTSKPARWLKNYLPEGISSKLGKIYAAGKTNPAGFVNVFEEEMKSGRQVVSHTADEMPELAAAKESGIFQPGALTYVARNLSKTREEVLASGVDRFVTDLREVGYHRMVRR